jgi:hypothetical protein
MHNYFKDAMRNILDEYGFKNLTDFIQHILGFQNVFVAKIQAFLAFAAVALIDILGIIDTYVWSPALGLVTISAMIAIRAVTGAIVKTKHVGEKFNPHKAIKTVPIWLAHVGIMSLSWHIGKADEVMNWLPSAIFVVFATFHFLLLFKDLVTLGLIEGELLTKIAKKISDKTGE